jgi:hypothetical protein
MSTPQQPETRSRRAARLAAGIVRRAANGVFEQQLQKYLSQQEWEKLAQAVARAAAIRLDDDYDFCQTVTEGDVADHKGVVNAEAVLVALQKMADSARKEGAKGRLMYLAQHFKNIMMELRVLKESTDGQEKP